MKSTTQDSFGTGRDVSLDMIAKWKELYWVFASGTNYEDKFEIDEMYLCTPDMMLDWFEELEGRFGPDICLRDAVLNHVKRVLSAAQLDRLVYLIDRGITYNNPHIDMKYVRKHGVNIDLEDPADSLQELMQEYD